MSIFEVFLTGLGLSMDAVAVSMTDAMVYAKNKGRLMLLPFVLLLWQWLLNLFLLRLLFTK